MSSRVRVLIFLVFVTVLMPAVQAADCNGNGREDSEDIAFGLEYDGMYLLEEQCTFWRAWPRDTPIAAGDLNGDGAIDLVTANCGTYEEPASSVSILLNEGDGTSSLRRYWFEKNKHSHTFTLLRYWIIQIALPGKLRVTQNPTPACCSGWRRNHCSDRPFQPAIGQLMGIARF